jgi:hypothetical protein
MAPKEQAFFNHRIRTKGLDWYLQHFEKNAEASVLARGEIDPNYAVMRRPEIRLLRELFPDLSILLVVRHPVKRMWSSLRRHWTYSYLEDVSEVGKDEASMLRYADHPHNDRHGDYRAIYTNWTAVFPKEQILMLRFDELQEHPNQTIARVLSFIGVEPDLDWIQSYREGTSPRNQSKADVEMPDNVRYYLSRRYLSRTRAFNARTGGFVQDWVEDLETCVAEAPRSWHARYQMRSTFRYRPLRWIHRLLDPVRTWWKVWQARRGLPETENLEPASV